MTNNGNILKTIQDAVAAGELTPDVTNKLLLSALISFHGRLDKQDEKFAQLLDKQDEKLDQLQKVLPLYRVLVVIGTTLLAGVVTLVWSLVTGQWSLTIH